MAERLLPRSFDLGFRALHAFSSGRPARTFAAVAATLARRDDLAAIKSLLQKVQGTITDEEWDEASSEADTCTFVQASVAFLCSGCGLLP